MSIGKKAGIAFAVASGAMLAAAAASAEEPGTMGFVPSKEIAVAMTDQELANQRGGLMGIAFEMTFFATVDNLSGTTGAAPSGSLSTSGVTPLGSYNIEAGTVTFATLAGSNISGNSGLFQFTTAIGENIVVNTVSNINIAIVNMGTSTTMPALNTIFPQ